MTSPLLSKLDGISLSPKVQKLTLIKFSPPVKPAAELIACGTWWTRPFALLGKNKLLAVILHPDARVDSGGIVIIDRFEMTTIASSLSALIPSLLLRMNLTPERWDLVRGAADSVWEGLAELHHLLGGQGNIEETRAVFADAELRSRLMDQDDAAFAEAVLRLDPSPENRSARSAIASLREQSKPPNAMTELGSWKTGIQWGVFATLAAVDRRPKTQGTVIAEMQRAAWDVMNAPPALDSNQIPPVTQQWYSTGGSAEGPPLKAAQRLIEYRNLASPEQLADPMWKAAEALAEAGTQYDASAHLNASSALGDKGEFARAFYALTAAGYWRSALGKKPFAQTAQAALLLAEHCGWTDVAEGIRYNIEAASSFLRKK